VAIAERLAAHYRERGGYTVGVSHRDVEKPPRGP
jgi:RNase adaptor protein for sRNA GlmZ degradation